MSSPPPAVEEGAGARYSARVQQQWRTRAVTVVIAAVVGAVGGCEKEDRAQEQRPPGPRTIEDATEREAREPPPCGTRTSEKGDCCTGYAPRPEKDPSPMCRVEGGTFTMGHPRHDINPVRRVTLTEYYIDQYEVTNAQYATFLNERGTHKGCDSGRDGSCVRILSEHRGGATLPSMELAGKRYVPRAGLDDHPVIGVSWDGAMKYCQWAGKTLPTEAQWQFAAGYDPEQKRMLAYPWGDQPEKKRAACHDDYCADGFEGTAPVGTFDGSDGYRDGSSPWGVLDMEGNAAELVYDCVWDNHLGKNPEPDFCGDGCVDPTGPPICVRGDYGRLGMRTSRIVRGSSYDVRLETTSYRSLDELGDGRTSTGLRCAVTYPR